MEQDILDRLYYGKIVPWEKRRGNTPEMVPVVIWEVTATDEAALDRYEGFPNFYYKKDIRLQYKGIRTFCSRRPIQTAALTAIRTGVRLTSI